MLGLDVVTVVHVGRRTLYPADGGGSGVRKCGGPLLVESNGTAAKNEDGCDAAAYSYLSNGTLTYSGKNFAKRQGESSTLVLGSI